MLQKRVVGRSDLEDLLDELVLLDLVLLFKLAERAHQVFEACAGEAHDAVFERNHLVGLVTLAHASITLLFVDFKDEGVHVRVNDRHRLISAKVILNGLPKAFHFLLDSIDLLIDLLEFGRELRVDDVVVLLGFSNVDALFQHGLKFGKLF